MTSGVNAGKATVPSLRPERAIDGAIDEAPDEPDAAAPPSRPLAGIGSAKGLAAWMFVPPIDAAMLLLPLAWAPGFLKAVLLMAATSMVLLFGAGRYRARLHLSVLDELPMLLSRLLAAGAVVATLFALTHADAELDSFFLLLLETIGLVVLGRMVSTQIILTARKRRVVAHGTVLVGGATRAVEMTTLLKRYPQYGLTPVGYVDDATECAASQVTARLGRVDDLEHAVAATGADVILGH